MDLLLSSRRGVHISGKGGHSALKILLALVIFLLLEDRLIQWSTRFLAANFTWVFQLIRPTTRFFNPCFPLCDLALYDVVVAPKVMFKVQYCVPLYYDG